jgi:sulfur-oxidizing protein SoxX
VPNFQGHVGNLGPALSGVGARLGTAQLRLRVINESLVNPNTIMPAFYKIDSLVNVDPIWAGQPILNAQQIEDVVAYLATLQ